LDLAQVISLHVNNSKFIVSKFFRDVENKVFACPLSGIIFELAKLVGVLILTQVRPTILVRNNYRRGIVCFGVFELRHGFILKRRFRGWREM